MNSKDWNPVLKAIALGIWVLVFVILMRGMAAFLTIGR